MRKIITKDEARKLTCPFIQNAALVAVAIPKITEDDLKGIAESNHSPANIDCIESSCMAWKGTYQNSGFCMLLGDDK